MNATISRRIAGVVLAAVALAASTAGRAAADVDVSSAAVELYARMNARDLAGVLRYISAAGFTEIGPSAPSVHVLKPAAFEALIHSDAVIKLRRCWLTPGRSSSSTSWIVVDRPIVASRELPQEPVTALLITIPAVRSESTGRQMSATRQAPPFESDGIRTGD